MKKLNIYLEMLMILLCLAISGEKVFAQKMEIREQKAEMSSASNLIPGTPVMKSVKATSWRAVKITWSSVKKATDYEVFRKENGKWSSIGKTKKTSFTHISSKLHVVEPGITYQYTVRALYQTGSKTYKGKLASPALKGKTSLSKVSGLKATALSDTQIQISWKKVAGATEYRLFRQNSHGEWKIVKKLDAGQTSYKHVSSAKWPISGGNTYKYTVRAYAKTSKGMIGGGHHEGVSVKTPEKRISKIIMIGHSRGLGMQQAVHPSIATEWFCKVSAGYAWLSQTVMPSIAGRLDGNTAVVIMMGVNDVYNQWNYVSYINRNVSNWTRNGAKIYFAGIGPVKYDPYVTNGEICTFNRILKDNLKGVTFIDTYQYLMQNGFSTVDGCHYTNETSIREYQYIMKCLK